MRILVAQMTRMGDVLQTSPLIRALKTRHPDAHVTAMVRRMGKPIAERVPDIDDIIVYDEEEVFLDLRSEDSDRLLHAYERASTHVDAIRKGDFDVVYNCTHSIASAMMLKVAGAPKVVGAHLSDDWQFLLRGRGVNYFFTSVLHREFNDLNLCDLFRLFLENAPLCQELIFNVTDDDRRQAATLLGKHGIEPDDEVICFQLGASDESKRWPATHFAALGNLLAERRSARIALVGVEGEAYLGQEFEGAAPGLGAHLFGKTTIPQLAALLERARLLVTNDTGTMHIAASVRCPIVLTSVGYVHFRETGPYGPGHCAIEARSVTVGRSDTMRHSPEERSRVSPDQVLRAVDVVLGHQPGCPAPKYDDDPTLAGVDLYVSAFAPDGCLSWYPVVKRPITQRDYIRMAYRAMWLEVLAGKPDKHAETKSITAMLDCYTQPDDADLTQWHDALGPPFDEIAKLAQQGARTTERVLDHLNKKKGIRHAKQLVDQLMRLDEETRLFGEIHGACRPLVAIARFERDNLEGADPILLTQTTQQIYRDLFARARLMSKKLRRITQLWSP